MDEIVEYLLLRPATPSACTVQNVAGTSANPPATSPADGHQALEALRTLLADKAAVAMLLRLAGRD